MSQILSAAIVLFFRIIEILILLRIILSWLPLRENRFTIFIHAVTEPILAPIRNMIARSSVGRNLMFDFSPLLAYLLLGFVEYILLLIVEKL